MNKLINRNLDKHLLIVWSTSWWSVLVQIVYRYEYWILFSFPCSNIKSTITQIVCIVAVSRTANFLTISCNFIIERLIYVVYKMSWITPYPPGVQAFFSYKPALGRNGNGSHRLAAIIWRSYLQLWFSFDFCILVWDIKPGAHLDMRQTWTQSLVIGM